MYSTQPRVPPPPLAGPSVCRQEKRETYHYKTTVLFNVTAYVVNSRSLRVGRPATPGVSIRSRS